MARTTAQWEALGSALTARGLEHHTRTSDKCRFCGPTQGICGSLAAEGLRGWHRYFWKAPQLIPGNTRTESLWAKENELTRSPALTPPPRVHIHVPRGSPGENGYDATLVS